MVSTSVFLVCNCCLIVVELVQWSLLTASLACRLAAAAACVLSGGYFGRARDEHFFAPGVLLWVYCLWEGRGDGEFYLKLTIVPDFLVGCCFAFIVHVLDNLAPSSRHDSWSL